MDSYSSPIAIKHAFKVSEEELKTKLKSDKIISSNVIEINEFPDLECRIDLKLVIISYSNGEKKEMLVAYLSLLNIDDDMEICSKFAFDFKSVNFRKYGRGCHDSVEYYSWGGNICSLVDLLDPEKKYIVDGEFIVEMKGIIFVKKTEKKSKKPANCLSQRLWNDEDEKDFLIIAGKENEEKTEFKIHKTVLGLYSPVFKRMFKTDMKEKQEGKVEIIDFDSDTVESAVAFCYEQSIFEDYLGWEQQISLHHFADKYDIEDLKDQTEAYMVEELSLWNICETTNALINLNAPKLRDLCFRFLLMAVKEGIPVKDMDILDKDLARDLLKKATSIENC